jgi:hypothetical protein
MQIELSDEMIQVVIFGLFLVLNIAAYLLWGLPYEKAHPRPVKKPAKRHGEGETLLKAETFLKPKEQARTP